MLFLLSRFNPICVELINTNLECNLEKVFFLMCAFPLERIYVAAWDGEMQEDGLCDPTKLGKQMGVWACGCLIGRQGGGKTEMHRWKEERPQNIGLNIKNTRLAASVDLYSFTGFLCTCVWVCTCVSTPKAIKNWMIQSCRPQSPQW